MNLAEIWDTPSYFYTSGYTLATFVVLYFGYQAKLVKRVISCLILFGFLFVFMRLTNGIYGVPYALSILTIVGAIILTCYADRGEWRTSIYLGIKAFMYGEFTSSLCWLLYYYLAQYFLWMQQGVWQQVIMICLFLVILVVILLTEYSLYRDAVKLEFTHGDLLIAALMATSIYIVSNLGYVDRGGLFSGSFARDIFAIRTLVDFSGIVMLYAFQRQMQKTQVQFEKETLRQIMEMQYNAYQHSQESIDMVNQKYHDLKHHIAVLRKEAGSVNADAYLNQMEQEIRAYEAQNHTGNGVLDTVLTNKSLYCQRNGIELKIIADGKLLGMMSDMEIAALFGNMLDNAIEGVGKISDPEKRLIRLYVTQENQFLRIRIENYCGEKIQFINGMPLTTKRDKRYHGFGMKSMQRTVEKYGGSLIAGQEDNWFQLKILIPMKEAI